MMTALSDSIKGRKIHRKTRSGPRPIRIAPQIKGRRLIRRFVADAHIRKRPVKKLSGCVGGDKRGVGTGARTRDQKETPAFNPEIAVSSAFHGGDRAEPESRRSSAAPLVPSEIKESEGKVDGSINHSKTI